MERNRWETAIRCLEVALHPQTADSEVIAGVNGFRRTAAGAPLGEVLRAYAGGDAAAAEASRWRERFDRIERENRDLRRRLEGAEAGRHALARHLDEAEHRVRALDAAVEAARRRAEAAEHRLAELRAASPARRPATPFRELLAAALDPGRAGGGAPVMASNIRTPWLA